MVQAETLARNSTRKCNKRDRRPSCSGGHWLFAASVNHASYHDVQDRQGISTWHWPTAQGFKPSLNSWQKLRCLQQPKLSKRSRSILFRSQLLPRLGIAVSQGLHQFANILQGIPSPSWLEFGKEISCDCHVALLNSNGSYRFVIKVPQRLRKDFSKPQSVVIIRVSNCQARTAECYN